MAELLKPDMPAVLARTNLARNLSGLMLPAFEAGSNAIHAINDRFGSKDALAEGKIVFRFRKTESDVLIVEIEDNGVGLDKRNYREFRTPFTGHKLRKNGKGFGRFIGFKVFEAIEYHSMSADGARQFHFDIYSNEELIEINRDADIPASGGSLVRYKKPREEYQALAKAVTEKQALNYLTSNFLTYLVSGQMPQAEVDFEGNVTDLRTHFANTFSHEESHDFEIVLDGEKRSFRLDVSRSPRNAPFKRHALLFFADNRLLGRGRNITDKLGRSFFVDSVGNEYVIIASVSGSYLDGNASTDRTRLLADEDQIKEIVDEASSLILETEDEQNLRIKIEQRKDVAELFSSQPLLRFGLSGLTIEEYVDKKPNNWNKERFVSDLAIQRFREERRWREYVAETVADPKLYEERKAKLFSKVSDTYRDALAEYVVHRKAVIEIADQLREFDSDGKIKPEEELHNLIFPRLKDSTSTDYYRHNLWLLDERLAFVSYASSDRTFHGGKRKRGDKVIDLKFFDEVFVAGTKGSETVMIIEFKKPGRDDYSIGRKGCDPIKQINDTVAKIRAEKRFVTEKGKTIDIPETTPITAYIIADLEPSLRKLADQYDFQDSWNKQAIYKYHEKFDIYVEVFGYEKLLKDAKQRNSPFFDVMLNEVGKTGSA